MNFFEAVAALQSGYKVSNSNWPHIEFVEVRDGLIVDNEKSPIYILVSQIDQDVWSLYEEPKTFLFFNEILPLLREGKKFRRKDWIEAHIFLSIPTDKICFTYDKIDAFTRWTPTVSDLLDNSWVEVCNV